MEHVAPGPAPRDKAQSGFTYIGLLIAIAIMGVGLVATGEVWRTVQQREKERELLSVGNQFRKAIELYYERTPGGAKRYPESLEDLLKDNRYPTTQRYLRKVYPDPMSDKTEWGLLKTPDGRILGVHSLSDEKPLKIANFGPKNATFAGAAKYSDWKFVYVPKPPAGRVTAPVQPAPPGRALRKR